VALAVDRRIDREGIDDEVAGTQVRSEAEPRCRSANGEMVAVGLDPADRLRLGLSRN
jgi:hypothetical protein